MDTVGADGRIALRERTTTTGVDLALTPAVEKIFFADQNAYSLKEKETRKSVSIYMGATEIHRLINSRETASTGETVTTPAELGEAFVRAMASPKTHVICMQVDAYEGWTTEGHTWWEIGTPQVSDDPEVTKAHLDVESARPKQRQGV